MDHTANAVDIELSTIHTGHGVQLVPDASDTAVLTSKASASADRDKDGAYIESNPVEGLQYSGSRAASPQVTFPASTPSSRRKARIQFATVCWALFLAGWNDGSTGPLLPRMQSVYHVRRLGFTLPSLSAVW